MKLAWMDHVRTLFFVDKGKPGSNHKLLVSEYTYITSTPDVTDSREGNGVRHEGDQRYKTHHFVLEADIIGYWGLILGLRPANERRRYFVTMFLIGWVYYNKPRISCIATFFRENVFE